MAEIKFTGFVENWSQKEAQHPNWAMRVTEPHSKREGDEFITIGRTYRTVKAGWDETNNAPATIDFSAFNRGDRVEIIGREITETREYEGKTYYDLIVKASSVQVVVSDTPSARFSAPQPVDADLPF